MSKKVCELCGYADNSYTIEENGNIMKVCKFCHDGHLERMGLPLESDKPLDDATLALDIKSATDYLAAEDEPAKVAPMTQEQLDNEMKKIKESVNKQGAKDKSAALKKSIKKEEIISEATPEVFDARIKITSPEVEQLRDVRPKTNFEVVIEENISSIKFIDAFKYIFNKTSYAIFLGVVMFAMAIVNAIAFDVVDGGLVTLFMGVGVVAISFPLMWYLSNCFAADRRAQLLRIQQHKILFKSMTTDCYRELKTKYNVIKSIGWLLFRLSIILPLVTIISAITVGVIYNSLGIIDNFGAMKSSLVMAVFCLGAIVAAIVVYWIFKLLSDMVFYKLDAERNQQIQQQTMLDMLSEMKKK